MKQYELTYLISPELKEEDLKTVLSEIESLVQEEDGAVIENKKEKTVLLGYEIKGFQKAIMAILKFRLPVGKQKSLQKKIQERPEVLRFAMEKAKPVKPERVVSKRIKRVPKEKKVELKGIEEKLEEILGE